MGRQRTEQEACNELWCYTLAHADPRLIHQHAVDAFTAQIADENTKPIALAFALIGLYLCVEKGYSGKQVQIAHMQLGTMRRTWPSFQLPAKRGSITVFDVVSARPGTARDDMIQKWCGSVWRAYGESREKIVQLAHSELYIA